MYPLLLWLIPTLEKFPRGQRFLLGDRIETAALDVLDLLIQATYTRERQAMLGRANLGLERLRMLARRRPATPTCSESRTGRHAAARPPGLSQRPRKMGFASLYPSSGWIRDRTAGVRGVGPAPPGNGADAVVSGRGA
jgi:hypothetical protein